MANKTDKLDGLKNGDKAMSKLDAVECLLSDARGQYIPRDFVANFDITQWGIDPKSWAANTCAEGPEDNEHYWEAWDEILNKAEFKSGEYTVGTMGEDKLTVHTWRLYQDGDLWALCYELMSDEEKQNFGFDEF